MTDQRKTLTEQDETDILAAKADDPSIMNKTLAEKYGVHPATIKRLLDRNKPKEASGAAGIQDIPHNKISPSGLNPRKTFDPDALAETAASIKTEAEASGGSGILQNLVVRPKGNDTFEIVAGERRWRAVQMNIEAKAYTKDIALPCRVRECTDAQLVELALLENIDRQDMMPMEEANAFQQLFELQQAENSDLTQRKFAIATADSTGKSQRYVELRLGLATKLCDDAKQALANGEISSAMARILAQHDHDHQEYGLSLCNRSHYPISTAAELASKLIDIYPFVTDADFDLELYTGEILEDPDADGFADPDEDGRRFKDIKQFQQLQRQAAEKMVEELTDTDAAFVVLCDVNEENYRSWTHDFVYGDNSATGIVIVIDEDFDIEVKKHIEKRTAPSISASASGTSSGTTSGTTSKTPTEPPKPKEPGTIAHREHARRRKSQALQNAVAADHRSALILACLGLVGGQKTVKISAEHFDAPDSQDDALSPDVTSTLKSLRQQGLKIPLGSDKRRPFNTGYGLDDDEDLKAYNSIKALSDDDLQKLFNHLVARQVGSLTGYLPHYGDRATTQQLAKDLGISGNEEKHGLTILKDDLPGLSKAALETVCNEIDIDPERTMKETIIAIEDNAPEFYVVPSLRFGEPDRIQSSMLNPTPPLVAKMTSDTECVNSAPAE